MYTSVTQKLINAYYQVRLNEARKNVPDRYYSETTQEYKSWLNGLNKRVRATKIVPTVKRFIQNGRGTTKSLDMTKYDDYVEGEELREIKIGTNYRVYFNFLDVNSIILIYGSSKRDQAQGILKARRIRDEYS